MIEKLNTSLAKEINAYSMTQNQVVAGIIIDKINELVDVVNDLVFCVDNDVPYNQKPVKIQTELKDPYVEQKKWLGCLCRFWDDDKKFAEIGILGDIWEDFDENPYFNASGGDSYKNCEPVKSDDIIIYKGE